MQEQRCEDLIDSIVQMGGLIIEDKMTGTEGCLARKVSIQKDDCFFKIGYVNLGEKQIPVEKIYCKNDLVWNNIPNNNLI